MPVWPVSTDQVPESARKVLEVSGLIIIQVAAEKVSNIPDVFQTKLLAEEVYLEIRV